MYQSRQSDQKLVQAPAAWQRLAAPMVALTIVLASAAPRMSASTSRSRSRVVRTPRRWSSHAPTTASSVFPTAIPPAVCGGIGEEGAEGDAGPVTRAEHEERGEGDAGGGPHH